jgi:hypothetical protein
VPSNYSTFTGTKNNIPAKNLGLISHMPLCQRLPTSVHWGIQVYSQTSHRFNPKSLEVFKFAHKPESVKSEKPQIPLYHMNSYDDYLPFALPDTLSPHIAILSLCSLSAAKEACPRRTKRELWPSHLLSLPSKMVMDQNWGATYQIGPAFTSYNILNLIHLIRSIRIYSVY